MQIEITTMCAVLSQGKVLMINRTKSWKGWAFLGGHLESGESLEECVKRELFEEAGIRILNPVFVGITHIFNPQTIKRHLIFNYVVTEYEGNIKDFCEEGNISWIDIEKLTEQNLAEGMEYRIPLFLQKGYSELYIEWNDKCGYTKIEYIKE